MEEKQISYNSDEDFSSSDYIDEILERNLTTAPLNLPTPDTTGYINFPNHDTTVSNNLLAPETTAYINIPTPDSTLYINMSTGSQMLSDLPYANTASLNLTFANPASLNFPHTNLSSSSSSNLSSSTNPTTSKRFISPEVTSSKRNRHLKSSQESDLGPSPSVVKASPLLRKDSHPLECYDDNGSTQIPETSEVDSLADQSPEDIIRSDNRD